MNFKLYILPMLCTTLGNDSLASDDFFFSPCEAKIETFEVKKPGLTGVEAVYAKISLSENLKKAGVRNVGLYYRTLFYSENQLIDQSYWIQRNSNRNLNDPNPDFYDVYVRPVHSREFLEGAFFVELYNDNTFYWITPRATDKFTKPSESPSVYYYHFNQSNITDLVFDVGENPKIPESFIDTQCFYSHR